MTTNGTVKSLDAKAGTLVVTDAQNHGDPSNLAGIATGSQVSVKSDGTKVKSVDATT